MKIKSFKILTRAAKDLQRRAITEPEKAEGLKPYHGVLQAIQGSYKEFTPWLDHLPPRLLKLIVDHQVAYGCVRVVFVALPGSALPTLLSSFLESDIANRLATGSNTDPANLTSMPLPLSQFKEAAIKDVQIRDAPVVGLRQAREAKCGRQLQTDTNHGHHFEYLAEFPDGSTYWFPSVLIAKDLTEEFEDLSMSHASEVAEITESKGTELTVRRRDNTVDHVHQNQVFWAEEPTEKYKPLHDEEIDGLVKHGHHDEHLDVCVPATLEFHSDWARFEITTAGTTVRRDDAFDAKVYENVTFTNTSIMWGEGTRSPVWATHYSSAGGERVFVAVGVHNNVRWCDVVTGIAPADWAGKVLAMYYGGGQKAFMREKTLSEYSVRSAAGTNFRVRFEVAEGHQLTAKFSIS
ncbi:lectin-like protein [Apiospora hydei]|uniref:Lectin-like protein n=1 Tax=Apiospora hydei TaxID=1337664 RepID=A0ABR1XDX2_9PEZI